VGKGAFAHSQLTDEASCLTKPSPGERGKQGEAPFGAQLNQTGASSDSAVTRLGFDAPLEACRT